MVHILHLETSTKNCSVSVSENGALLSLVEKQSDHYQHSENLHEFIDWAMQGAEIPFDALNAICVSKGPGSYTGLRIGVSAAKGLCFALNCNLLSMDSLSVLAQGAPEGYDYIIPLLDARRMEVYTAIFNSKKERISPIEAKILNENSFMDYKDSRVLFLGDGAEKAQNILQLPNADFKTELPSAKNMIKESYQLYQEKKWENVAYFEPFYLKEFVAGKKKNS